MRNSEQQSSDEWADVSPQEKEEIERELHMQGRPVRVDETMEQYRQEREKSWAKKLEAQAAQDQNELREVRRSIGSESTTEEEKSKNKFKTIAEGITIDEKKPPKPEQFFPPVAGNMFGENDEPTLAGKIIARDIYDKLVERPDYKSSLSVTEILRLGREALEDFEGYIKDKGDFSFDVTRPAGKTGFHLNGEEGRVSRDHLFYFSKTTKEWKNPDAKQVRAYLTIDPAEIGNTQKHFVDLCTKLYESGVDFTAKAASPNGLEKRTDNMVFYLAEADKPKAEQIIRDFLEESGIGKGNVYAAEEDSEQEGLSWAPEPDQKDTELWQKTSGSSERASYNVVVAAKVIPRYLRRLAEVHSKIGDNKSAETFNREADRVESLIKNK